MHEPGSTVHRVTCAVSQQMSGQTVELLAEMGVSNVLVESGRSVRRQRGMRRWGFWTPSDRLVDSPVEIFQFCVAPTESEAVIHRLISVLEVNLPGRGSVYVQEAKEYAFSQAIHEVSTEGSPAASNGLLSDLALITCIMSMSGSGEELAKLALELGTGVPTVTHGAGTGMRDRLGLLRITVPQEKELVHLAVPAFDAEGLMRMLIEQGRLNRPGKGFIYCKPVLCGLLDTSLQIGPQEHTASMEQVIAAIDDIKNTTAWRRRFPELDADAKFLMQRECDEIVMVCMEEHSRHYAEAAVKAGAGGATTSRVRRAKVGETAGGARERSMIVSPRTITGHVLDALMQVHEKAENPLESLTVQPVALAFSHRAKATSKARAD